MNKTISIDTSNLSYEEKKMLKCNLFAIHFGGNSSSLIDLLKQIENEKLEKEV